MQPLSRSDRIAKAVKGQFHTLAVSDDHDHLFFITNWTIEADWEAPSADQWTIPIGGGFGKQFKIGQHQFQFYGQLGNNVVRPDAEAATWRGILALTSVF
jgi:hypothetical protein